MAEDSDSTESANSLRERLSSTSNLATDALARAVIAEESLGFVEVSDFKGVSPEKVEERARELNSEREAAANQALTKLLKDKGVEDIDAFLQQGGQGGSPNQEAFERARRQGGTPTGGTPQEDLSSIENDGGALMMHHFAQKEAGKK